MWKIEHTLGLVFAIACLWNRPPAAAATMYMWRDPGGTPHYSNVPVTGQHAIPIDDAEQATTLDPPPAAEEPLADADENTEVQPVAAQAPLAALSDEERDQFSSSASLRRQSLERTYRAAQRKLADLDHQLTTLSRTRTQHADRGANAGGAVAYEERPLLTEKTTIEHQLEETRTAYGALTSEVSTRLGTLPDWWMRLH